jgi:7-cyano-7-deazaguanine synthase
MSEAAAHGAVLLLSGGLDSYTAGAISRADGFDLFALTIRYGQVHVREVEAARQVAAALNVKRHVELTLDLRPVAESALTGFGEITTGRDLDTTEIPSTYVPARNTILLSLALAWAETLGITDIVLGVDAVDYSGYPDCRPECVRAFETLAGLATRAGVTGSAFQVHAPLMHMTKAEIVRRGIELGLDYGLTWSCYNPRVDDLPCGACDSCVLRARGFAEAGAVDPVVGEGRAARQTPEAGRR